jgi:hypothetical protein
MIIFKAKLYIYDLKLKFNSAVSGYCKIIIFYAMFNNKIYGYI